MLFFVVRKKNGFLSRKVSLFLKLRFFYIVKLLIKRIFAGQLTPLSNIDVATYKSHKANIFWV